MTVHLLYVGRYEDRGLVGIYATRELAEKAIVQRAFAGESLDAVEVEETTVHTAEES